MCLVDQAKAGTEGERRRTAVGVPGSVLGKTLPHGLASRDSITSNVALFTMVCDGDVDTYG